MQTTPTRFCENGFDPNYHPEWASALSMIVFIPSVIRTMRLELYGLFVFVTVNILSSIGTHLSQGLDENNMFLLVVDYADVVTTVLILSAGLGEIAAYVTTWYNVGIIAALTVAALITQTVGVELLAKWSGSIVACVINFVVILVTCFKPKWEQRRFITICIAVTALILAVIFKTLADEPRLFGLHVDDHGCNVHTAPWAHALWHVCSGVALWALLLGIPQTKRRIDGWDPI
jgi:hypothetical protein